MRTLPYIWRPWQDRTTGRWHLVRLDRRGVRFDTSEVSYPSRKAAKRDADVWNAEEGQTFEPGE